MVVIYIHNTHAPVRAPNALSSLSEGRPAVNIRPFIRTHVYSLDHSYPKLEHGLFLLGCLEGLFVEDVYVYMGKDNWGRVFGKLFTFAKCPIRERSKHRY